MSSSATAPSPSIVSLNGCCAMDADKLEVQKQWDQDPCGASTVRDREPGTLEFYRAIRDHRYLEYAPWMNDVMGFADWRGKDVLEIGVGLGSDHFRFAQAGASMTAIDLSQEHLRQTKRHLQLERLSTNTHYGDAEKMPFSQASFDAVYSFGVLHHTPNTEAAIAEVHRVLRPGGTAIVGLYHRHSWFFWVTILLVHGVLKAGLIRKGWRTLLSEIEYRSSDNGARPLVKLYSRQQTRALFANFSRVHLQTVHVEAGHLHRFGFPLRRIPRAILERYCSCFGWYVIVKAVK